MGVWAGFLIISLRTVGQVAGAGPQVVDGPMGRSTGLCGCCTFLPHSAPVDALPRMEADGPVETVSKTGDPPLAVAPRQSNHWN